MRHGLRALGFSAKNIDDGRLIVGVLVRGFIIEGVTAYFITKHDFFNKLKERILSDKYYIQAHVLIFDDKHFEEEGLDVFISQLEKQAFKMSMLENKKPETILEVLSIRSCVYARLILESLNDIILRFS